MRRLLFYASIPAILVVMIFVWWAVFVLYSAAIGYFYLSIRQDRSD